MAIQYFKFSIKPITAKDYIICQRILDKINHYCNLYQLADYSMWDHNADLENIVRYVHFDQYYALPQLPSKLFPAITKIFAYMHINNEQFQDELTVLNNLFNKYSEHKLHKIDFLQNDEFKVKSLYQVITHISSQMVHNGCLSDLSHKQNSFSYVPLSINFPRRNKGYYREIYFINHPCINLILFEYLFNLARTQYIKDCLITDSQRSQPSIEIEFGNKFGKSFESLLSNELSINNIEHFHELNYYRNDNPSLGEIHECKCKGKCGCKGESDLIIETVDYILIFECKTKGLSTAARSGDELSIILDIYSSFLHSQYQASKTKYLLEKQAFIKFEDNRILNHKNRKIITISVSLLEYFQSLMDKHFSRSMFEFFTIAKFNTDTGLSESQKELFIKINNVLSKLRNMRYAQYTEDMFFLSMQQILTLLKYSSNSEEFARNMLRGSKFLTGDKDWYTTFYGARKLGLP